MLHTISTLAILGIRTFNISKVLTHQEVGECLSHDLIKKCLCSTRCEAKEVNDKEILATAVVHEGKECAAKQAFIGILWCVWGGGGYVRVVGGGCECEGGGCVRRMRGGCGECVG